MVGIAEKIVGTPHEPRRGWLKNGNPPGDLSQVRRCGAKNRRGTPCGARHGKRAVQAPRRPKFRAEDLGRYRTHPSSCNEARAIFRNSKV